MRILALTPHPYDTSPGQRFRIEQWQSLLKEQGVEILYSPFTSPELGKILHQPGRYASKAAGVASAYLRQLGSVYRARRFDLIYVFREAALIGPAIIEQLIAWQGRPIVFDFDDATFVPYKSPSNGYLSHLKFPGKTASLCRAARQVMAGNDYLRDYARKYNDAVSVVPTTIDTDRYRPALRRPSRDGLVTIGWTGSFSTAQHLRTAVPALTKLASQHRFRLVVIGAEAPEIAGAEVVSRPWRASSEVEDLADIDIGIMPLPEDPWSKGKCGLKALQYMALGIPPVVSPVGVNSEIVRQGENGIIASTEEDWVRGLGRLFDEPTSRELMGEAARKTVEERYSARVVAPRVRMLFEKAAA